MGSVKHFTVGYSVIIISKTFLNDNSRQISVWLTENTVIIFCKVFILVGLFSVVFS